MASSSNVIKYNVEIDDTNVVSTIANTSSEVTDFLNEIISSLPSNDSSITKKSRLVGLGLEGSVPDFFLQLCHKNRCIIIELRKLDSIPGSLKTFLGDESICFVGVNINDALAKLNNRYGIICNSGRELGPLADKVYGTYPEYSCLSLAKLANEVLDFTIPETKRIRSDEWFDSFLSGKQINYVTVKAYVSFAIGRQLLK